MTAPEWTLTEGPPTPEEYIRIRKSAGCHRHQGIHCATIGLSNSFFSLTVRTRSGEAIGMGRIVGDGGLFFQVTDIAVSEAWQGRGIGRAIMERIRGVIGERVPRGGYISLMADGNAWKLYEKYGFALAAPESLGMYLTV